ncbi:MAG TPA: ABC transporter substrate-binding protein [Accumulibacter sp.]|uniref:substrate-binding periplasmic protein n=2 Tax=Accumulibacter sp. TaxID=2053492 RepID=UPI002879D4A4|nr:ABC transporter substrate-binding protein [Accumulibacter sp.]MDS4056643.1 ABC transporter substrate-binding protein [Accumulibacter sp.]HMV06078.1 ABC transporter substrate-binding protein [Accumulibacter sp.]HMW80669.1 ABC transporter substrate-binding protein [Accumulibacter sp.]HNB67547.1 ABC transporter substrate-binding protein [Accumulibacter sp.]HNC27522.1 ABC transporter substrate-binding protein [Accumulibacter sp.]
MNGRSLGWSLAASACALRRTPASESGRASLRRMLVVVLIAILGQLAGRVGAADVLSLSFGKDNAPFALPETLEGISFDILRQTLGREGYLFKPVYVPYERRFKVYKEKDLDVLSEARPESVALYQLDGFLSVPAIRFDNVAVFLKKNRFSITRTADLAKHSVISWQGAQYVMGDEYAAMVKSNKRYQENSKQRAQVMMLFAGRVEVLHIDTSIFAYWRNQVGKTTDIDVWQDIETYHFGEIYFNYLFRDRQVRDLFDARFKELRERGDYARIYQKYTVLESKPEAPRENAQRTR